MTREYRWVPALAAVGIVFFSLSGMFQIADLDVEGRPNAVLALIILLFLLGVSVLSLVILRLIVLPAALRLEEPKRNQILASAYAFAVAPSVYGVVVALFTARGVLVLPFLLIAVLSWITVWNYLRGPRVDSPGGETP
jgi:hypothetical protein